MKIVRSDSAIFLMMGTLNHWRFVCSNWTFWYKYFWKFGKFLQEVKATQSFTTDLFNTLNWWTEDLAKGNCKFPRHLMLPKGQKGGITFQLFFISKADTVSTPVYDYSDPKLDCDLETGERFFEYRSLLFSMNRRFSEDAMPSTSMHFEVVEIFFNDQVNGIRPF